MKRCPTCKADYFDNMLEFCLEDGARLSLAPQSAVATAPNIPAEAGREPGPVAERNSEETVLRPAPARLSAAGESQLTGGSASVRVIERTAVGLALAHNWWQWLYIEKAYVYSITDYILSANFLMWLLLLAGGTAAGIYSIKKSRDKTLAIVCLVTLAINLILYLVPRR